MRLNQHEIEAIKQCILASDRDAKIYLYGSRTDDSKKGGDIDLLVLSKVITFAERRRIKLKIYDAIGEQKIDLLVAKDTEEPFVRIALSTGIEL